MAIILAKKQGRPTVRPDDDTLAKLYNELPTKQIAEMYGVKPSTVRGWASKARRAEEARAAAEAAGTEADGVAE